MKVNKLALVLALLFLFSTKVEAHGPSRQKVSEKIEVNADFGKVWNIVKDFKNFKWNSEISCMQSFRKFYRI